MQIGNGLELVETPCGLTLVGEDGLSYCGDFEKMIYRISNGRLAHEMLIHITKTKKENPIAIDATAGLGEDSLLLAAYGYRVTMFERNPVVAALLSDCLNRYKNHPVLGEIVSRMELIEGDSIYLMEGECPDLIYLDPMFPPRKKSGLVNKRLQLIQRLETPCKDDEILFEKAKKLRPAKIVVKRPLKGSFLAGKKPSYSTKGKAIRYDVYLG